MSDEESEIYYSLDDSSIEADSSVEDEIKENGTASIGYTRCRNWKCRNSVKHLSLFIDTCGLCGSEVREVSQVISSQDL